MSDRITDTHLDRIVACALSIAAHRAHVDLSPDEPHLADHEEYLHDEMSKLAFAAVEEAESDE